MRKDEELVKCKRAHEKSTKFNYEVKRVITKSRPEEWTTQEECQVYDLKVMVGSFDHPGDLKCIMKKGEMWER
jgi:hypothetical protein